MLRLVLVFFVAFCLAAHADESAMYTEIHGTGVYPVSSQNKAKIKVDALKKSWEQGRIQKMAKDTDRALHGLMHIAILNLKWHGHHKKAAELDAGWKAHQGEVERIVVSPGRKIGSFEPLSMWLAFAYATLEESLGYDVCRTLRLTDIQTFNYTIPVVFHPCPYGLDEFTYHFVHDDPNTFHPYKGLAPVVSYWLSVITCSVATYGAGYFFICSPIGMLVETGVDRMVAPWLAPKIYGWAGCAN